MIYLGAHLSSSKGYKKMGQTALQIGANTFQCFLRNPRGRRAKAVNPEDLAALRALLTESHFGPVVGHAPYIMNPCSQDEGIRDLAVQILREDLAVMEQLPGNYYNLHPGSHVGQGIEVGIRLTAAALNQVLSPEQKTIVLLETMAGKGSEVGGRFEDLRAILDRVEQQDKIGVCLDTCHVWDGGYDIARDLDGILETFDRVVGLARLRVVHINDSLNALGSKKDRHACIGEGSIGIEAIVQVLTHPALQGLPFILETPTDDAGHQEEIARLRERVGFEFFAYKDI